MLILSCTRVHVTQSNLIWETPKCSKSVSKSVSKELQQHDETPPGIALKMAAGFDKKTRKASCFPAAVACRRHAVSLNWIKLHGILTRWQQNTPFLWALSNKTLNHCMSWIEQWLQRTSCCLTPVNSIDTMMNEGDIRGVNFGLTRPLIYKPWTASGLTLNQSKAASAWLHINLLQFTSPCNQTYTNTKRSISFWIFQCYNIMDILTFRVCLASLTLGKAAFCQWSLGKHAVTWYG